MRLSWYADTDIAVFSIWQGGKCTGTFRLPMDDLSRMIEILQRGPKGRIDRGAERGPGERQRGHADSGYGGEYASGYAGERDGEYTVVQGPGGGSAPDYDAGTYAKSGQYGSGHYGTGDYGSRDYADYGPADRYPEAGYRDSAARPGGQQSERYEPADYGRPDYDQGPRDPRPAYKHEDDRYQADVTGQRSAPPEADGYASQRFVPPYVGAQADASELDFFDDAEYRQPADPAARPRHSAGRHSGGQGR
jgi:hypothetical protein